MKHYIFIIFLAITLNNGVNNSLFAQQFDSTLNVYKIAKNNYTYFKLPYDYKRNYRYYKNHKYNPWGDYDNSFLKDSLSDGVYKVFLDSTLSLIMYETTIKNYKKNGN